MQPHNLKGDRLPESRDLSLAVILGNTLPSHPPVQTMGNLLAIVVGVAPGADFHQLGRDVRHARTVAVSWERQHLRRTTASTAWLCAAAGTHRDIRDSSIYEGGWTTGNGTVRAHFRAENGTVRVLKMGVGVCFSHATFSTSLRSATGPVLRLNRSTMDRARSEETCFQASTGAALPMARYPSA